MRYLETKPPVFTLTAGPVDAYPEVLRALGTTVLYDYDPAFQALFETVTLKAQKALGCDLPPLILQGEPVLALEGAAASLIARDDVVLNLASGVYGKGFGYWAARYARKVEEIEVPYDTAIDPDQVRAFLKENPEVRVVCVCNHDTPSGTLNDIDAIGAVTAEAGALLIVDAVSSWAGMRTGPTESRAAVYVTGPNKCLGCPPALSLVAVSQAGWEKIEANPDAPFASMLSLTDWKNAWKKTEAFPFTPSVAEINGLDAALDRYLAEGPEAVWARHALTARVCREGIKGMGIELWPVTEDIASPTATAVRMPEGIDAGPVLAEARARYGVSMSAGRAETLGKLIRIGHMGPTAQPAYALLAVSALGGALKALGAKVDVAAGLAAAQAAWDAAIDQ
ncbi:pyridoxamine--pyruvate transaminase [Nitratireductor basaltis]|uniref:Pyridoxamine-pyruvate aminotransferase n=1 Tax=Nitratireductor basaltis TaxID=472175 RepID=A0A084U7T1_9HYPH|nr:alanine--glyoxylate aminotransferase family protein [Nitratireductor basaltis]KFB09017.1 Pyridoxamine-pyruvate aminotransferase [Nitratireductor basaltis]